MSRSWVVGWAVALGLASLGCGPTCPAGETCGVTPPPPPQAFLVITDSSPVIGRVVRGTTSASGCAQVAQVRILVFGTFVADANYAGPGSPFAVDRDLLLRFFPDKGIAASLSFTAEVLCSDGRTGVSLPTSVTFFPAESVVRPAAGPALPDSFIVEGGVNGRPVTFLGCNGGGVNELIRVDTQGGIVARRADLPFVCDYQAIISARTTASARPLRWLLQPEVGAFSFVSNAGAADDLTILNSYVPMGGGKVTQLAMSPADLTGDAVIIEETSQRPFLHRVQGNASTRPTPPRWTVAVPGGIPNATPVVALGSPGFVHVATWNYVSPIGQVRYLKYNYQTGGLLNGASGSRLWELRFDPLNVPLTPPAAFSDDGAIAYVVLLTASGTVNSYVVACSTASDDCDRNVRRWTSPAIPGLMAALLPRPATLAVAGAYATYFLDTGTGAYKFAREEPVRPEGSLIVHSLIEGMGTQLYALHGPNLGEGAASFPSEVVAVDEMGKPETWRLQYGAGTQPQSGLWLGVDEGGQAWLRVGLDQVKPLKNSIYCGYRYPPSECKP